MILGGGGAHNNFPALKLDSPALSAIFTIAELYFGDEPVVVKLLVCKNPSWSSSRPGWPGANVAIYLTFSITV